MKMFGQFGIILLVFLLFAVSLGTSQEPIEKEEAKRLEDRISIPVPISIKPSCRFGEPLWNQKCNSRLGLRCPYGYDCNPFSGVCCPSDPEDICQRGEIRKGKCGPKNYPCPCGYRCRNHPAKGYVVCCPNDHHCHCPTRVCEYGYPLTKRTCGIQKDINRGCPIGYHCVTEGQQYGVCCPDKVLDVCKRGLPLAGINCRTQRCPVGFTCNTDPLDRWAVCCPDHYFCRIGIPIFTTSCGKNGNTCPNWYTCNLDPTKTDTGWCCANQNCKMGQPIPGLNCLSKKCPKNYDCIRHANTREGHCCLNTKMYGTGKANKIIVVIDEVPI